jgi:hypothetical protein
MKSYIIITNNIQLQIDSKDSKTNCMIKVVPGILTGSNDASPTQMPMLMQFSDKILIYSI